MIINGTHVQGIFLYSDTIEFEKGDFVVYNNTIYICTAENPNNENFTVSGKNPQTDRENYSVYPGNRISTAQEYFDYVENPTTIEDKYISSHTLSEILSTYMNGFNEKGIISNYISYNNGSLSFSSNLEEYLHQVEVENILDTILGVDNLNNAIFRISRSIVNDILDDNIPLDSLYSDEDKESVILKQYTYSISNDTNPSNRYRIQELIDPINTVVMYRFSKYPYKSTDIISGWKSSFVDSNFLNEVNYVKNYYNNLIKELEREKTELNNNFLFRNVAIEKNSSISLSCDIANVDKLGYIPVDSFNKESCVITLVIQEPYYVDGISENTSKNTSLTIDLLDSSVDINPIKNYRISNNNILTVDVKSPTTADLTINVPAGMPSTSIGKIINIYYRQYNK